MPCLVLGGKHDELTPASAGEMHRNLPKSRIRRFKDSSHMPFWAILYLTYPKLYESLLYAENCHKFHIVANEYPTFVQNSEIRGH